MEPYRLQPSMWKSIDNPQCTWNNAATIIVITILLPRSNKRRTSLAQLTNEWTLQCTNDFERVAGRSANLLRLMSISQPILTGLWPASRPYTTRVEWTADRRPWLKARLNGLIHCRSEGTFGHVIARYSRPSPRRVAEHASWSPCPRIGTINSVLRTTTIRTFRLKRQPLQYKRALRGRLTSVGDPRPRPRPRPAVRLTIHSTMRQCSTHVCKITMPLRFLYSLMKMMSQLIVFWSHFIYIYIYICVCVCACACVMPIADTNTCQFGYSVCSRSVCMLYSTMYDESKSSPVHDGWDIILTGLARICHSTFCEMYATSAWFCSANCELFEYRPIDRPSSSVLNNRVRTT